MAYDEMVMGRSSGGMELFQATGRPRLIGQEPVSAYYTDRSLSQPLHFSLFCCRRYTVV